MEEIAEASLQQFLTLLSLSYIACDAQNCPLSSVLDRRRASQEIDRGPVLPCMSGLKAVGHAFLRGFVKELVPPLCSHLRYRTGRLFSQRFFLGLPALPAIRRKGLQVHPDHFLPVESVDLAGS